MILEGRRALVTGGASGIGAAICRRFAAEGAEVVVGDIALDAAESLAGEIGGRALALDVADHDAVRMAITSLGALDVLVNNAGVGDLMGWFTELTPDRWRRTIAVNLEGVLSCTQAALPAMQRAGYGRIVCIASEAGRIGARGNAVYAATKGAVIAFTRAIACENARYGITANSIAPGPIDTPMLDSVRSIAAMGERFVAAASASTLLRRLGRPEEVAAAVAFLASEQASYVTGETLGVSGGMGLGA
ncbi:MAG TPA: SDR family NAD(P)-dependent oxidoreductase [Candidatus Dormibacteraeota bacterium]|jgi:2-hydroxycyclohexanecarboxyl-CoA dehydrogenase|nr:SDR family NAD(P)-dependent oxidoreductase [Candidatus Dormibacteraeota bacterium]